MLWKNYFFICKCKIFFEFYEVGLYGYSLNMKLSISNT